MASGSNEPDWTVGRHVRLRPITQRDYPALYALEVSPDVSARWRFRGATPSPESFARSLYDGVLLSLIIEDAERPEVLGVVTAYKADMINGHVCLAAVVVPESLLPRGIALEGVVLFISHCFNTWPFRKLWIETNECSAAAFLSSTRFGVAQEARLRDYEFVEGQFRDRLIYSISRADWEQTSGIYGQLLKQQRSIEGSFRSLISFALDLPEEELAREVSLRHDLVLDSLQWLVLIAAAETHAGVALPHELIASFETMGDVEHWCELRRSQQS